MINENRMSQNYPIILASGSSIRKKILKDAGVEFKSLSPSIDEAAIKSSMMEDGAKFSEIADALAEAKSVKISRQNLGLVIGSDQIMVMGNTLYDKPKTIDEARARLKTMRGQKHALIGAIVISENGMAVWRHLSKTYLTMRNFSDEFLEWYINQEGDYLTQSVGGYRFESYGAHLFSDVEGDFFSILGLSLLPILDYLRIRKVILS